MSETATETSTLRRLPHPCRERWQPLRSGVLQIFRFDEQEFWYEHGRLLLRGNNGAGKSRVLALQLPFLLDGELASHRVEPDRSPDKRMEWNLLLGKHKDRRGYTWLEFGRVSDDGTAQYLTIGCGLQAVESRGITGRWFFISSKRIGDGLDLKTANRHPITREQLVERIGSDGAVYTTGQDYRRAVDQRLFGLGEQRYEALIELLITLRQPQLSKTLNEEALSQALSDALPPLTQRLVDEIAEAMRGLEQDREQLDSHRASAQAIRQFLDTYERYARAASRRKAEVLRLAHSRYETTSRQLRTSQTELGQASDTIADIGAELRRLKLEETQAETAQATLLSSPQMAAARELEGAKREADERQVERDRALEDSKTAGQQLENARRRFAEAGKRAAIAQNDVEGTLRTAAQQAEPIGMRAEHERVVSGVTASQLSDQRAIDSAKSAAVKAIEARRKDARVLRDACDQADEAGREAARAKSDRDRAGAEVDAAQDVVVREGTAVTDAVESLMAAYRAWAAGLTQLRPLPAEDIAPLLREWGQTGGAACPLDDAVRSAVSATADRLAAEKVRLESRAAAVREEVVALTAQRNALVTGRHEPPPSPHTRTEDSRESRVGAPLWALCEFRDFVSVADRANLEAALEAAGLLDAWVLPTGEVLQSDTFDTILTPVASTGASEGRDLSSVLRPCVEAHGPVEERVVSGVLQSIGLGSDTHRTSVSIEGTWHNGPLSGRWSKPTSEHIGSMAREARRLRRLAELDAMLQDATDRLQVISDEVAALDEDRRTAHSEEAAAPRGDAVRQALAREAVARRQVEAARSHAAQMALAYSAARELAQGLTTKRDDAARDLRLSEWIARIAALDEAINQYRDACVDLWPALGRLLDARLFREQEDRRCTEAETAAADWIKRAQQASERYETARARHETLDRTKGADVKQVVAAVEAAKQRVAQVREEKDAALARERNAVERAGGLRERVGDLEKQRVEHEQQRDEAVEGFRRFIATGVLNIAVAEQAPAQGELSVTRLVELSRDIEQALAAVPIDDAAWDRHQKMMFEQFKALEDLLVQHDLQPEMRPEGDVLIIRAVFQGRSCAVDELRRALEDEVSQRQSLLDARERQILENHLLGEVAQHLHDRLRLAEQLVQQMNAELERVPTNSGMVLRFRWEPKEEGPAGLREVRRRLLGAVGTWTPAEREAVGKFLQDRIKAEQAANDTGTWQDHLTAALDYRAWHSFIIDRNIDGHWQRLTRRTHGTGSGGEKAVALMVPMFAAAASHYRSASPVAPRPILLDEAFAGIDPEMRARCAGLLRSFDLDFIMTSDIEWCCYSTLPGVAICQFSTRKGVDGVYVSRLVWNGRERVAVDDSALPVKQAAPAATSVNGQAVHEG